MTHMVTHAVVIVLNKEIKCLHIEYRYWAAFIRISDSFIDFMTVLDQSKTGAVITFLIHTFACDCQ